MSPSGRRILIVEDQAILGMELEFVLEQAGHDVVGVAFDSRQALALAVETRPDLAVVDINLKDGRTGISVAQKMALELGVTVLFATAEPELIPEQFAGAWLDLSGFRHRSPGARRAGRRSTGRGAVRWGSDPDRPRRAGPGSSRPRRGPRGPNRA